MKTWMGVLLVIATIVAPPLAAKALRPADDPTNDITITGVTIQGNTANVSGTYTVETGYTFSSITIYIRPAGGVAGEGQEGNAIGVGGSFLTSVGGVPNGTFDVQAMLTVTDSGGNPSYFFSNTMTDVVVPSS